METLPASQATLKQRLGRVGRTMNGDYVALYLHSSRALRKEHIDPKMVLEAHEDVLFSLQLQLREPCTLHFPIGRFSLPRLEDRFFRFPNLGGKKMAHAFFFAMTMFHCGDDILLLAGLRMKVPTKTLQDLAQAGQAVVGTGGDVSTVIGVMRKLDAEMPTHQAPTESDVIAWCNSKGLSNFSRVLYRSLHEYHKMKTFYCPSKPTLPHNQNPHFAGVQRTNFDTSTHRWNGFLHGRKNDDGTPNMSCPENYERVRLERATTDFVPVLKALVCGFAAPIAGDALVSRSIYVHCAKLDGALGFYSRAADMGDLGDADGDTVRTLSSMHSKSIVGRMKPKPDLVFALEFMLFGESNVLLGEKVRLGVLQMCEVIRLEDLPADRIVRRIVLHADEIGKIQQPAEIVRLPTGSTFLKLTGPMKEVVKREIELRASLRVVHHQYMLTPDTTKVSQFIADGVVRNMKTFLKAHKIMNSCKFFWSNAFGLEVDTQLHKSPPHILLSGRQAIITRFCEHLDFWKRQMTGASRVECPDHFMSVDLFRRPASLPNATQDSEMRARLHHVTAIELSEAQVVQLCTGPKATRETRMEIVARIAVQIFNCKVVGGFVRDWVVNGERKHLPGPPSSWVEEPKHGYVKYEIKEGVLPKDLDIEMSMEAYFDVNRFVQQVRDVGITVDYHEHIAQRHVFLFEVERGPFTADFIEPHFAVLHTQGDFNVNQMCLVKYPDLIGLKARTRPNDGGVELTVDNVITSCLKKELFTMQLADKVVAGRERKMLLRGWKILDPRTFIPVNDEDGLAVRLVSRDHAKFKEYDDILKAMTKKGAGKLVEMYEIHSSLVDGHYAAMKAEFERAGAANERDLFHGTDDAAVQPILSGGFDDHYWKATGFFGRGAYFADDPNLSVSFTGGTNPRTLFVCSVLLGKVQDLSDTPIATPKGPTFFPDVGNHSVKGRIMYGTPPTIRQMEYIVYRYGQAKPKYMLRFNLP